MGVKVSLYEFPSMLVLNFLKSWKNVLNKIDFDRRTNYAGWTNVHRKQTRIQTRTWTWTRIRTQARPEHDHEHPAIPHVWVPEQITSTRDKVNTGLKREVYSKHCVHTSCSVVRGMYAKFTIYSKHCVHTSYSVVRGMYAMFTIHSKHCVHTSCSLVRGMYAMFTICLFYKP